MPVTVEERSGYAIVSVVGRLDVITAPEIAGVISSHSLAGLDGLVLDLARVSFIDSSGIGMLVVQHRTMADQEKRFVVANPPEQARLVLRITNLEQVLEIESSVDRAISGSAAA